MEPIAESISLGSSSSTIVNFDGNDDGDYTFGSWILEEPATTRPLGGNSQEFTILPVLSQSEVHRNNVNSPLSPSLNPVLPEDVDAMMAHAMTQLSVHEREEVYNDIHGVADEIVETPEMIDEAIGRMKIELFKMSTEATATAYQQALAQDSSYVYDYKSLLSFLRAERFDPVRAAIRLTKFYSFKLEAFGIEKLTKDIYQDDLTQSERDGMYNSTTNLLPFRDRGGRSVSFMVVSLPLPSVPQQELVRRGFYAGLSHSRDEENQKKGLSCVVYFVGDGWCDPEVDDSLLKANKHWGRLTESIPVRHSVIHFCYSSPDFRLNTSAYRIAANSFSSLRTMVRGEIAGDFHNCHLFHS